MQKLTILCMMAGAVLASACHGAPPEKGPPPQPSASEIARQKRVKDSLENVALMRTDSLDRAREVALQEKHLADSIEAARLATLAAARDSAEKAAVRNGTLRDELRTMVHFGSAQALLSPEDQAVLDRKVAILEGNPDLRLRITGACDERGSDQYNMALGERRASAVMQYLISKGIAAARLDSVSSGEGSPVDAGHDETAWAQNRRSEFAIVGEDGLAIE